MAQPPAGNLAQSIQDIFSEVTLFAQYQPIVSVGRKTVSGIEGLIRGIRKNSSEVISPASMFDAANEEGYILEFDRLCRERVLESFSTVYQKHRSKLLFVNIDPSVLDKAPDSEYFHNQVMRYNIEPKNIVIEISETKVQGNAVLKQFTDKYKDYGFLIALDDVGTGFSNMDRILLVKPDIIKVDISIIRNIDRDYYKQGVFKALVSLANEIGATVVAEGVETLDEAIKVLKLGGHLIQGYYFSRPQNISSSLFTDDKISYVNIRLNEINKEQIKEEMLRNRHLSITADKAAKQLSEASVDKFGAKLSEILSQNDLVECAYILDKNGIQISDTIKCKNRGTFKDNLIYYSTNIGADHSLDRYYYPLACLKLNKYITEPYISLASGNLCITVSTVFENKDNEECILCMDFLSDDINRD